MNQMDLEVPFYETYVSNIHTDLLALSGREHYRLLTHLSTLFQHRDIIDIGTHMGYSAYALAYNETNQVYTFDIVEHVTNTKIKEKPNVTFVVQDLFNQDTQKTWSRLVLDSALIFLDVDPHDGLKEIAFYQFLVNNNYKGIVVCDDIWYFKGMRDMFWSQIPEHLKYDITPYGHWSGTGVINFTNQNLSFIPPKNPNNDWTLVTAYFDLSKYSDHNTSVRPKSFYFNTAQGTMTAPYNLVVYCDADSLNDLVRLRPEHLKDRTQYHVIDFDTMTFQGHDGYEGKNFATYRDQILKNRQLKPYQFDPRNNASYYLFCLSRYALLKRTIELNPFNSTHFAWINVCIERMGYNNLVHLDEALGVHRDKFSTCYIDYIPKTLVDKTADYFRVGRCGMCSGFFTGNADYMYRTCHEIEAQFLEYLEQGYGHADEQLYNPVFFKHPELFEHYYGDYAEMITNYHHIYENPQKPLSVFIRNSFDQCEYRKCSEACEFLWESYISRTCHLTKEQVTQLCYYRAMSQHAKQRKPSKSVVNRSLKSPKQEKSTIITLLYNVGNPDHIENLLKKVHQWLQLSFPVIIWTDDTYYQRLTELFKSKPNAIIYKRNIKEFEVYQIEPLIQQLYSQYVVTNRNPIKDTVLYHMLMYSRPEMWKYSITQNPFQTSKFICMDFGLVRFTNQLSEIETWTIRDKIKMLQIYPYLTEDPEPELYFRVTHHNVAGGMVTGSSKNLLELIDLFYVELKQMIEHQWCQLDEALMACVIRKHPDLFEFYYGDYSGIISNYHKTRDVTSVSFMLQKYLDRGHYYEVQKILNTIDYRASTEALTVYLDYSILNNYYTMNGTLSPVAKDLMDDPNNQGVVSLLMIRHVNNLKFYKQG
jgi:hypothetical protein